MTESSFDSLKSQLTYLSDNDVSKVESAYLFARRHHEGQLRMSGEPYIVHLLAVATTLSSLHMDVSTVVAGLLHDVVEDTVVTVETVTKEFGEDVARLVQGVTKLGKIQYRSSEEAQAENFRKLFLAMSQDIRVLIIKLADRLHNMQTIRHLNPDKQRRIALETREIFAPLAHRIGMWSIKWELEDLTMYVLEYEAFQDIKKKISAKRGEREGYIQRLVDQLQQSLHTHGIEGKVKGRPKHFYSIYQKLQKNNISFDELYDALGIRIIVASVKTCYEALGVVHTLFKPVSGRFKDYIAMPKSNMYQSLHTTIVGPDGKMVEIQIRTADMNRIAEYGIAAHWAYKKSDQTATNLPEMSWLRTIVDSESEQLSAKDYLKDLKGELFTQEVFVFSPKGDVLVLSDGATPLDFAYLVHTEVGHRCKGAKVNGVIVNLNYRLKNGDQVDILTSKSGQPNSNWLKIVQTRHAKSKIKQWFKKQDRDRLVQLGRDKLLEQLVSAGFLASELASDSVWEKVANALHVHEFKELFLQAAHGEVSIQKIIHALNRLFPQHVSDQASESSSLPGPSPMKQRRVKQDTIQVLGQSNVLTTLSKCCMPVPGDDIIGFVTRGRGVSVHRRDCPHVLQFLGQDRDRLIPVQWGAETPEQTFVLTLYIEAFDGVGILQRMLSAIAETNTNVLEVSTKTVKRGEKMTARIKLDCQGIKHLLMLKQKLLAIPDVSVVRRA